MITQNKVKKPSPNQTKRFRKLSVNEQDFAMGVVLILLVVILGLAIFRNHQLFQKVEAYETLMRQPILEQRDNEIVILKKKNEMLEKELEYYILTEENHYVDETVSE